MQITDQHFLFGFALTLLAGMATGIGGAIAFFFRRSNRKFLTVSLGFSAGVMVYISLVELLASAQEQLRSIHGHGRGSLFAMAAFFGGIGISFLIDKLIPDFENPHEFKAIEGAVEHPANHRLLRSGLLFALAIGIHNFPEGMAVFLSSFDNTATGISIALAIAIHNIPEGITVSVPVYEATGNRKKAFLWSFLSGLAEPAGALIAGFVLLPFLTPTLLTLLFAAVAGVMIYISFDELLPLSEQYGEHHLAIAGVVAGMLVMALTLACQP